MNHSKSEPRLPKVALLEARMGAEICALVKKHGGAPTCVPAVSEKPRDAASDVAAMIDGLTAGHIEVVIVQTGVSVNELARIAKLMGRMDELIQGLRETIIIARGPKPVLALKRIGVATDIAVPEPHTTSELIAALSFISPRGRSISVIHHGERNTRLIEALQQQNADISELYLYQWELPENISSLKQLICEVIEGVYDAIAFTSQVQVRHLFDIARMIGVESSLTNSLRTSVITAAVGPTCAGELEARGIPVNIVPIHPKMGHMIRDLMIDLGVGPNADSNLADELKRQRNR